MLRDLDSQEELAGGHFQFWLTFSSGLADGKITSSKSCFKVLRVVHQEQNTFESEFRFLSCFVVKSHKGFLG